MDVSMIMRSADLPFEVPAGLAEAIDEFVDALEADDEFIAIVMDEVHQMTNLADDVLGMWVYNYYINSGWRLGREAALNRLYAEYARNPEIKAGFPEFIQRALRKVNEILAQRCVKCSICVYQDKIFMFVDDLRNLTYDIEHRMYAFDTIYNNDFPDKDLQVGLVSLEILKEIPLIDTAWLENAVKYYAKNHIEYGNALCVGDSLGIYVPTTECLLAMICRSLHDGGVKHDQHILELMQSCGLTGAEQVLANFRAMYPDCELSAEAMARLEYLCTQGKAS